MKLPTKKEAPQPKILLTARMHVTKDMTLGINEETGSPFYVLKLELPTDMNGVQAILSALQSDGSIPVQVLDGTGKDENQH